MIYVGWCIFIIQENVQYLVNIAIYPTIYDIWCIILSANNITNIRF